MRKNILIIDEKWNEPKLKCAIKAYEKAKDLPAGWYFFVFDDGSFSDVPTGTNYPTSATWTTVHPGQSLDEIIYRIVGENNDRATRLDYFKKGR